MQRSGVRSPRRPPTSPPPHAVASFVRRKREAANPSKIPAIVPNTAICSRSRIARRLRVAGRVHYLCAGLPRPRHELGPRLAPHPLRRGAVGVPEGDDNRGPLGGRRELHRLHADVLVAHFTRHIAPALSSRRTRAPDAPRPPARYLLSTVPPQSAPRWAGR